MIIVRTVENSASRWFAGSSVGSSDFGPDESAIRLFCLPYAGGGAVAYRGWQDSLPRTVRLDVVALPGRETRLAEPPSFQVRDIAAALAGRIDRPYAVYGHSMGGRVAFEVVRELRRMNVPLPMRLYVAACRPPHVPEPLPEAARGSDDALIREVTALGGTPEEIFADPDLRSIVLPIIRADFEWLDRYRYVPEPPLSVPIVGIAAVDDPTAAPDEMAGWARHTTGPFRLHSLRGGHFFLSGEREQVTGLIAADLLDAGFRAGRPRPLALPAADEVHVFAVRSTPDSNQNISRRTTLASVFAAYGVESEDVRIEHSSGLRVRLAGLPGLTVAVASSTDRPIGIELSTAGRDVLAPEVALELLGAKCVLSLPHNDIRLRVQTIG
ncbi:MAG TPA: thioesterase domain-containing protein [Pseudonocardiaceae bacterium]|nr:thioesterase domain-containing protein [Pseudonocardiaceae bacterium]